MECNEKLSQERKSLFSKIYIENIKSTFIKLILCILSTGVKVEEIIDYKTKDAIRAFACVKSDIDLSNSEYNWMVRYPQEAEDYIARSSGRIGDEYFFTIKVLSSKVPPRQMKPEDVINSIYKYFYKRNLNGERIYQGRLSRPEVETLCDFHLVKQRPSKPTSPPKQQELERAFAGAAKYLSEDIKINSTTNEKGETIFSVTFTPKDGKQMKPGSLIQHNPVPQEDSLKLAKKEK